MTAVLELAGVERFFAATTKQDHGFGWSRSKWEALLRAGDWWVDGLGKDGAANRPDAGVPRQERAQTTEVRRRRTVLRAGIVGRFLLSQTVRNI